MATLRTAVKMTFQSVGASKSPPTDWKLMATLRTAVKMTFQSVGGDFDAPTKESLAAVVEALARKASTWGTPEDVMLHHKEQILAVLRRL